MLIALAIITGATSVQAIVDRNGVFLPHVESYWESWQWYSDDFSGKLATVPVAPPGAQHGVNIVNVAFASVDQTSDYGCYESDNCVTHGVWASVDRFNEGVQHIHSEGGFVKIAVGGDVYGNIGKEGTEEEAFNFVQRIARVVIKYDLDGVDFTQASNCWSESICSEDMQLRIIQMTRLELPDKIISFTFQNSPGSFSGILTQAHPYLDYIMPFELWDSWDSQYHIPEKYEEMGIPRTKIVLGLLISAYDDESECVDLAGLIKLAEKVRAERWGGIMTWSLNSDTNHRYDHQSGKCETYQTGESDATYINAIAAALNR